MIKGTTLLILILIFLFMSVGGDLLHWMSNQACYQYLGCNAGFFGYDALVHLVSGITIVSLILWFTRKSPSSHWRIPLVMIALSALVGVSWEFLEYSFDHFRILVLHQNLLDPLNRLTQPTNSDTMGDLTFGIIGASITATVSYFCRKNK